ncbi:hypothetical protein M9H77_35171 [Catharanthus roseus]|uniref:Uncharacterized protein n=1 Tax=Catharanthus roseus TaxID=4058 RepID=A0ACB9ZQU5_CATRO|nr:hypothetical protein M9H77_35171 [Catharanthus roseus]
MLAYWAIFFTFFIFLLQPFILMMNNRVGLIRVEWAGWSLMPGGPSSTRPDPAVYLRLTGYLRDSSCSSLEEHPVTDRHRAHENRTRRARSVSSAALADTLRVSRGAIKMAKLTTLNQMVIKCILKFCMYPLPFLLFLNTGFLILDALFI